MTSEQLHQKILDENGYIVVAYFEELPLGHVIPVLNNDDCRLNHPTVVSGLTTWEDYDRQARKYWQQEIPNPGEKDLVFHKVVAE